MAIAGASFQLNKIRFSPLPAPNKLHTQYTLHIKVTLRQQRALYVPPIRYPVAAPQAAHSGNVVVVALGQQLGRVLVGLGGGHDLLLGHAELAHE